MADERPFIKLVNTMPDHPKVEGLSDAAFRLLVTTWCWCHRQETDGRVKAASWSKRGTKRAREELIEAGLAAVMNDGGVVMHDYLEHQRSAAEAADLREKRRTAGSLGGQAKAANRVASANPDAKPSEVASAKQTGGKPLPDIDVDREKDLQNPSGSAAAPVDGLRPTQRSKRITDAYAKAEPMCNWPSVNGVVLKAVNANKWTDDEIQDAVLRLAREGRGVTTESLRIELAGFPPRNGAAVRSTPTSDADRQFKEAMARAEAKEAAMKGLT